MLDCAFDIGGTGLVGQQGDFLQRARFGLLTLKLVEDIFAVEQGFGQQARFAIERIAASDSDIAQGQHRIVTVEALEHRQYGANHLAPAAVTQLAVLASADQQHAFGLEVRQALQQQGLAQLAGQVAALEHRTQGTPAGFVDCLGAGAEFTAFSNWQDQCGGFQGCSGYAFYNQFHVRFPE
ncbi:hypothetical protein D3C72_1407970 [compost metagenome]